ACCPRPRQPARRRAGGRGRDALLPPRLLHAGSGQGGPPGRSGRAPTGGTGAVRGLPARRSGGGLGGMRDLLPFLVVGLSSGSIYGLAGVGLVLTYRTAGVFNFAHGAVAALGAYLFY